MKREKYINIDAIFESDEREAIVAILAGLEVYIADVPGIGDLSPWFRKLRRLPLEHIALTKKLWLKAREKRTKGNTAKIDDLWDQVLGRRTDAGVFESFIKELSQRLPGARDCRGWVVNDYFNKAFRDNGDILLPRERDGLIYNLFKTLQTWRNNINHFAEIPIEEVRNSFLLALIWLVDRYFDELAAALLGEDEFIEYSEDDFDTESAEYIAAKAYIDRYMAATREKAAAVLLRRFAGTAIAHAENPLDVILNRLPRVQTDVPVASEGVTYVMGDTGSGKTVALATMMLVAPPRPFAFYFYGREWPFDLQKEALLPFTAEPAERFVFNNLLDRAFQQDGVCVIADTDDVPAASAEFFHKFNKAYPGAQCIVAAESSADAKDKAGLDGFNISKVQPLDEAARQQVMRTISVCANRGVDLSHELQAQLGAVAHSVDLSEPITLMWMANAVAAARRASSLNYTELIYSLEREALTRKDIDDEERAAFLANPIFGRLHKDSADVEALAAEVDGALRKRVPRPEIGAMILASRFGATDEGLRTLFEHCYRDEQSRKEGKLGTLATLTALALLEEENTAAATGLEIHPGTERLARASATLTCFSPDDDPDDDPDTDSSNRNKKNKDLIYRPSPRYIASRFMVNLLDYYRAKNINFGDYPDVVETLLITAATGTKDTLKVVFQPWWLCQWLIIDGRTMPGEQLAGVSDSLGYEADAMEPLYARMTDKVMERTDFAMHLVDVAEKLRVARSYDSCLVNQDQDVLQNAFQRILSRMNDAERLGLIEALENATTYFPTMKSRFINMAVLMMDVPATIYYKTNVGSPYPGGICALLAKLKSNPKAFPMLKKLFEQALELRVGRYTAARIIRACLNCGMGRSKAFWEQVRQAQRDRKLALAVARAISEEPIDKIPRDVADAAFSPAVTSLLLSLPRRNDSGPYRYTGFALHNPAALMPVTTMQNGRAVHNRLGYRVYSVTGNRALIAVEGVELAENSPRLLNFENGTTAWVTGVYNPQKEWNTDACADIAVSFRTPPVLPATGTMTLIIDGQPEITAEYDFAATRSGCRTAVVRIHAARIVQALQPSAPREARVKVGNIIGIIREVTVFPLKPSMRMLEIKSMRGEKQALADLDIPRQGTLAFRWKPESKDVWVKRCDKTSTAWTDRLDRVVFIGLSSMGLPLWGQRDPVSPGTLLHNPETGVTVRVRKCHDTKNSEAIPEEIGALFKSYLGWTSHREGKARAKKYPFVAYILEIDLLGRELASLPEGFTRLRGLLPVPMWLRWSLPVPEPCTALWDAEVRPAIISDSVPARIEEDAQGMRMLRLPDEADFQGYSKISLAGLPLKFNAAKIGGDRRLLKVPVKMEAFINDSYEADERTVCLNLYDSNLSLVKVKYRSLSALMTGSPQTTHRDMADLAETLVGDDPSLLLPLAPIMFLQGRGADWLGKLMLYGSPEQKAELRVGVVVKVSDRILLSMAVDPSSAEEQSLVWARNDGEVALGDLVVVINGRCRRFDKATGNALRAYRLGGFRSGLLVKGDGKFDAVKHRGRLYTVGHFYDRGRIHVGDKVSFILRLQKNSNIVAVEMEPIIDS